MRLGMCFASAFMISPPAQKMIVQIINRDRQAIWIAVVIGTIILLTLAMCAGLFWWVVPWGD